MFDLKRPHRIKSFILFIVLMLAFGAVKAQDEEEIFEGEMIADLGFRPQVDGFGFENYGESNLNLTEFEVQRLFGDMVCEGDSFDEEFGCYLTPTAQMWMDEVNEAMSGGHCEGMATLSLLFYTGIEYTDDYGGGDTIDLELEDNELLQREIAYWWATQATNPTDANEFFAAPSEILNILADSMSTGEETFTLGIYMPDGSGGHAITPYAVVDQGDDIYWILVYDNNWPGEERYIEVDYNADTWWYNAATNPDEPEALYEGDAETGNLSLTPTSARLEQQECDFCGDVDYESGEGYTGVSINARGALLSVTDDQGNVTGYLNGEWVNNIPGARMRTTKNIFLRGVLPPQILVPNGSPFKVTATEGPDTPPFEGATFTVVRSGSVTRVGGIELDDTEDTLNVDGSSIQYASGDGGELLTIEQGVTTDGEDYHFSAEGQVALSEGGTLDFSLDPEDGAFQISGSDANEFSVNVDRFDEEGNISTFQTDALEIEAGESINLNAGEWEEGDEITGDIIDDEEIDESDETDASDDESIDETEDDSTTDDDATDDSEEELTDPDDSGSDSGSEDEGSDDSGSDDSGSDAGVGDEGDSTGDGG
jgi:hypothetical protein